MVLRVTSPDTPRAGYRADGTGSDKATQRREPVIAGTPSAALAGLVRQHDRTDGVPRGAMQVYSVRGVSPVSPGDDSEFGRVPGAAADKSDDILLEGVDGGLSADEAAEQADQALGKIDPQSNFAALSPVTSATAIAALSAARESLPGIALRGADSPREDNPRIDPAQAGDGSSFGEVVEVLEDKEIATYKGALGEGASAADAQKAADQAVGRANPRANFSADAAAVDTSNMSKMRRLATALRPSGLHGASSGAGATPRLQFPTVRATRFA